MATENANSKSRSFWVSILAAFQFLLVTPAFIRRPFSEDELGKSIAFFPLAGLMLGLMLAFANAVLQNLFPNLVRAAVLLGIWVLATGAFHLDGFLDAIDGLLGGSTPEQRMHIMRDERIGAFGFAGGILLLLLKFSALASMETGSPGLILAPTLARWAISAAIVCFPYARPNGLGRSIKDHAGRKQLILSSINTSLVVVGAGFFFSPLVSAAPAIAAVVTVILGSRFTLARLPGLTGDIYGAICEMVETSVLVVLSIVLK